MCLYIVVKLFRLSSYGTQVCLVLFFFSLRREVSLLAVKNCKAKAAEIAQAVSCRLGPVTAVREDSTEQWFDDSFAAAEGSRDQRQTVTLQQRIKMATIHVAAKVTVTFEIRSTIRKSKQQKS